MIYFVPERDSQPVLRLLTMVLGLMGIYPQYTAIKTLLMGTGVIKGNWKSSHKRYKKQVYLLEPVAESLLQFLVQSVLAYIVLGPGDSSKARKLALLLFF